jgi:CheY-like chemotaxis protein
MKAKKTVLVIEDEKNIREAITDTLFLNDFLSLEACNGKEGVKIALSKHPDLILLDLLMPVMDGMTAFKKIRQDVWGAKVPVVIMTNVNETEKLLSEDIMICKPDFYLIKSDWDIHDVMKKIKKIIIKHDKKC